MTKKHPPVIRASEIGEYVYCARAWWLRRVVGVEPTEHERRARGVILHQHHGHTVIASRMLLIFSGILFMVAVGIILLGG